MRKLELLNKKLKGKSVKLDKEVRVGSGATCKLRASHDSLSDEHARFFVDDKGRQIVELIDKKATLLVNSQSVMRSTLRHGDSVRIGPIKVLFKDEALVSSANIALDNLFSEEKEEQLLDDIVYDFTKDDLFYLVSKEPRLKKGMFFTIPSVDRFIDQAQAFLSRLAKQSGMDEIRHEGFMTCTKELILNAHRHGHKYDESKTILVEYKDLGDRLSLFIKDEGIGFDHKTAVEAVNAVNAEKAARDRYMAGGFGGLGFQMIVRMSSKLEYNESGNAVTFEVLKEL